MNLVKLVDVYFEESYKYYITYEPNSISDAEFDGICKVLYDNFNSIPTNYREILDKDSLSAGTGFSITREHYKKANKLRDEK